MEQTTEGREASPARPAGNLTRDLPRLRLPGAPALPPLGDALARLGRRVLGALDGGYRPGAEEGGAGIALDGVSAGYAGRLAIEEVTGRFAPGSLTAVIGPNGAGKSTLLAVAAGLKRPMRGRRILEGPPGTALAYMPQADAIDRDHPVSVLEFAALGAWRDFGAFRTPPYALLHAATEALRMVRMHEAAERRIRDLSLGQFRRVLFARVIVQRAPLVLLDEPFAGVDEATTAELLGLLQSWHAQGRTVVAVLHDLEGVRAAFPSALLLARRVVAWGGTSEVLTPENLARAGMGRARAEPPRAPAGGLLRVVVPG